jgi:hypothetical protein
MAGPRQDSASVGAERILPLPGPEQGSRSAQAIEPAPPPVPAPVPADPGASIAGVVRVNGSLPSEPFTLCLTKKEALSDEQRVTVASDGRFEFAGLTEGQRVWLWVPYRYRFARPDLDTRVLTVEAPRENLVLELERRRCLTGRLVSRQNGEPVEGGHLQASITRDDGNTFSTGAELEGNRFFVRIDEDDEVASLSLEAWADGGLLGSFEFTREEIPMDLDLGDLALAAGGVARILVLDPEHRPVEGARVHAPDLYVPGAHALGVYAPGRSGTAQETDSEGRATLRGLPPDATLEVLARGFDPLQFDAPISSEPMEVMLERANRLTIAVLDSAGDPEPGMRVRISSEKRLFIHARTKLHPSLVPQIVRFGEIAGKNERGWFTFFTSDERGRIELQSILPGMSLTVSIEDEIGTSVHEEVVPPLRAQEKRELTIRFSREPRSLSGNVEDWLGHPLEGANVTLRSGGRGIGIRRTSGADGRFQFDGLHADAVDLTVTRRGFVSASLSQVPVLRDMPPVRVGLEAGRDVRVSVVDVGGKRIDAGSVTAWLASEDRRWSAVDCFDGSRLLFDIPALELEVRLELAGKEFRQALSAHAEELVMIVPELGRLEVTCDPDPDLASERLGLLLRSQKDGIEQWAHLNPNRTTPVEFETVLPGTYDLSFATRESDGSNVKFVFLRPPMRLQVAPGGTTRVQLR